jgi:hypothetical protein
MTTYALWDSGAAPTADVVCLPALRANDAAWASNLARVVQPATARAYILPFTDPRAFVELRAAWSKLAKARWPTNVVPALYAETQAALEGGICDLVGSELDGTAIRGRRALVLCPREELTLADPPDQALAELLDWAVDVVLVVPPAGAPRCQACDVDGRFGRCSRCDGASPPSWTMHPSWVRKIVDGAREIEVPVAFLGWGYGEHVADTLPVGWP